VDRRPTGAVVMAGCGNRRPTGAVVMAGCGNNAETVGDVWIQMFGVSSG
jgi:hypothetical protein